MAKSLEAVFPEGVSEVKADPDQMEIDEADPSALSLPEFSKMEQLKQLVTSKTAAAVIQQTFESDFAASIPQKITFVKVSSVLISGDFRF